MTGYTVHTGATEQFVAGWDQIFKKPAKAKGAAAPKKGAAKKKAATKVAKSKGRKAGKKKN
jgi:hypothetical protein